MHMVRKMDAGDSIDRVVVPIAPEMTYGELERELCVVGSKALIKAICALDQGGAKRVPQDESQVTFAPKIELEDCEIKWNQPAQAIHNLVRGVNPHPGAWCIVKVKGVNKRLKVIRTRVVAGEGRPGEILVFGKEGFVVACQQGALQILELQLEGKKAMPADEFIRGHSKGHLSFD